MTSRVASGAILAEFMNQIEPVETVVQVGAATGHSPTQQWRDWPVGKALLVAAEAAPDAGSLPASWQYIQAVVAAEAGEANYFMANRRSESGLLDPALLTALWPGLRCESQATVTTVTLSQLLAPIETALRGNAWLIIDCLAAVAVLRGAGQWLASFRLIWLRVQLGEPMGIPDSTLAEADGVLAEHGFYRVDVCESLHPRIGHAIYLQDTRRVRDVAAALAAQNKAMNELLGESVLARRQLHAQLQNVQQDAAALDTLRQDAGQLRRDMTELREANGELRTELASLRAERDAAQDGRSELSSEIEDLQTRLAASSAVQAEHAAMAGALEQARGEIEDRQQQIGSLEQQLAALRGELDAARDAELERAQQAAALGEERATQIRVCQALQQQAEQAEAELQAERARNASLSQQMEDLARRRDLLQAEMLKAEAQLELMKDVLLRDALGDH